MLNAYSLLGPDGNTVAIQVSGPKRRTLLALIDAVDLPLVSRYTGLWQARWQESPKTFYVIGQAQQDLPGRTSRKVVLFLRLITDAPVELDVDHLNHNGLDNRRNNLQPKTRSQNLLNRKGAQSNSQTGLLGVFPAVKHRGKSKAKHGYVGQLRVNGKRYRSAIKNTPEEASTWYWAKRRELGIPDPEQRVS
jgi:hypothetical protein